MYTFIQFVKKEFLHIFRDYRTLLVLFGMPPVQLLIFGYAVRTEVNDANIAIYDRSKDYISCEISQKLLSSQYFKLTNYISNESEIEAGFRQGKYKVVVCFAPEFSKQLERTGNADVQFLIDASDPNISNLLYGYISSIIADYQNTKINKLSKAGWMVTPQIKMLYNPEMKSVYMFVPGLLALILMLVSALMTSIAITKEKETGTMEVLLVSPLKPSIIIIGKVIPYTLLALLNAFSVLALGVYVFGVPFKGSFILLLFETLIYLGTALSLGIMISTFAKTQQVALMVSLAGLLLPTTLLSGFIFPTENMPLPLQFISNFIPAKWYLIITRNIMLKGLGFSYIRNETLILISMMVFFLIVSMKKFKIRLD
ncbi:MAG: ABC transporter permease [Candidatus Kapabacteria bacterium]|nr:ABC transporter permease [Candidatus Kapabacteria bacterium]